MMVLAVDQSYTNTGLALIRDGEIIATPLCLFPKKIEVDGVLQPPTKREKRMIVVNTIKTLEDLYTPDIIVVEKVRTFVHNVVSISTLKALHALSIAIQDGVSTPVFAMDTRAWKKAILGKASATKADAVTYVSELLPGCLISHDTADACCIGLGVFKGVKLESLE